MKISQIETLIIFAQWRNWVLVKVSTDEGLVGFGEATVEGREKTVAEAVNDLSRRLQGKNPLDIEALYQLMVRASFWRGGIILSSAISGIEQALWDLAGQYYSTPVYRLLGGACRERVRVYASGWIRPQDRSPDQLVERAREIVARGYTALKAPCFLPGDEVVSKGMVDRGIDLISRLREGLGPEIEIMVELHGRFSFDLAMRAIRGLEALDPAWIEEPCGPENPANLERFARQTRVPIASGERLFGRYGYLPLIQGRLASVIQPDLCHVGGILEAKKIASLAEVFDLRVAPHNPLSPVSTTACLHFAISTPNFQILELIPDDVPWKDDVFPSPPYRFQEGFLVWEERPGLGLRPDEEAAGEHPYQALDLPLLSEEDGAPGNW